MYIFRPVYVMSLSLSFLSICVSERERRLREQHIREIQEREMKVAREREMREREVQVGPTTIAGNVQGSMN